MTQDQFFIFLLVIGLVGVVWLYNYKVPEKSGFSVRTCNHYCNGLYDKCMVAGTRDEPSCDRARNVCSRICMRMRDGSRICDNKYIRCQNDPAKSKEQCDRIRNLCLKRPTVN